MSAAGPPWRGPCSLCGRRRPGASSAAAGAAAAAAPPRGAAVAAELAPLSPEERLLAAGFKPAAKKKSCDINYSKWDALEDSDADDDAATEGGSSGGAARAAEGQPVGGAEGPGAGAAAPPGISGEQRLQVVEEMLELCRKAHAEARSAAPDGSREAPRAPAAKLPATYRQPVGVIGTADLARFGCSSDRMLVSCYGDIFDVSGRPDLYGSGKLSWHAGKDITWVVVTGDETPGNCNRFYDIFKLDQDRLARFMQIICWKLVSLEDEFGEPVGRLEPFMKEDELPPPPEGPAQECRQQ